MTRTTLDAPLQSKETPLAKFWETEWRKTPYAGSTVRDCDSAIRKLLEKYGVTDIQWTETTGLEGRPVVQLRFILGGKTYRLMLEALDANVDRHSLLTQIKRATFYYLKSVLDVRFVSRPPVNCVCFSFVGQVS